MPPSISLIGTKGAQVECNAPLSAVNTFATLGEGGASTAIDATAAADLHRQKVAAEEAAKEERLAKFQYDTEQRLKRAARTRKQEASAAARSINEQLRAAAGATLITDRPAPGASRPGTQQVAPEPPPPPPPSQLERMRYGLAEQAAAARSLMLSECALLRDDDDMAAASGLPPPPPPPPTAEAAAAMMQAADTRRALPPRPTAESRSVMRAVVSSAARADREAARNARKAKVLDARRAAQRAQLAEAVATERDAAERAEALRCEVAALEHEAIAKEAHVATLKQQKSKQAARSKAVEAERYVVAYRKKLQAEAATRARPLPSLCPSGLDPLDNKYTEHCARNSPFFKNPQAYGRAISALFVRPIVLD